MYKRFSLGSLTDGHVTWMQSIWGLCLPKNSLPLNSGLKYEYTDMVLIQTGPGRSEPELM